MSKIDPNKKLQKIRTEQEMRMALETLVNHRQTLRIPPYEDADMVISDVIEELLEARKKLAILEPLRDAMKAGEVNDESGNTLEPYTDPSDISYRDIGIPGYKVPVHNAVLRLRPISQQVPDSAMTTREEAEKAANAELEPYINSEDTSYQRRGIPGYKALACIPVISTENLDLEALSREITKEEALYFIGLDDGYHGAENLEVLREEQEG